MTSEALAAAARAHPGALYRVLRALASVGIFAKDESGFFRTTPIAELLRTDSPESLRAFVIMLGEPESWVAWGDVRCTASGRGSPRSSTRSASPYSVTWPSITMRRRSSMRR